MSLLAALAATGTGTPTPDPTPITPDWRNVAYGPRTSAVIAGTVNDSLTTTADMTLMRDATEVTLTYMAATGNAPVIAVGNDVTYQATVNGQAVTWGGQPTGTCPSGGTITSDPITVDGASGDVLTVTTTGTAPGGKVPKSAAGLIPYRVNAVSDEPSVVVIGSSSGVPKEFTQGMMVGGVPVCNLSIGGTRAWTFTNEVLGQFHGMSGAHGFTHAFLQVGINSNGRGVGEMCQAGLDLAIRLRSYGIGYVAAMVWKPHTNSTDGWTTVEGQSPKYADRATAVAWLRRGAPVTADGKTYDLLGTTAGAIYAGQPGHPFSTVVDWGAGVQAATNPDAFRVDHGAITTDGLHINATGYGLAAHVLTAWAQAL